MSYYWISRLENLRIAFASISAIDFVVLLLLIALHIEEAYSSKKAFVWSVIIIVVSGLVLIFLPTKSEMIEILNQK